MPDTPRAFSRDEQVAFLNHILEEHTRHGEAWTLLRRIHADEAHNCALLGKQIQRLGAGYSHATGEFLGKLLAIEGPRERVEFLATGLRWAVKRFDEALPRLDGEARDAIAGMRETHLRSIASCEAVARILQTPR